MHLSVAFLFGVLFALVILCGVVAVCIVGVSETLTFVQDSTGIDLGVNKALHLVLMTDIHYISQKLTDNGAYFTAMVTNSDGKTMLVIEALADAFIEQMIAEAPDAVVISGDITFNGEKQSHLDFAEKLTALTDAGIAVYVMPGNHDLDYRYAASFEGDGYTLVDSVSPEEFREIYANFGYESEQLIATDEASLSYMARLSETQALLMIDCNSSLSGVLSDEVIAFAEAQLIAAKAASLQVIAVSHQSLMDHNSLLSFGYTMVHNADLLALYEQYGVICNLSGHVHMQHIATSEGGVADIATSALSVYPNQYGVLHWDDEEVSYQTNVLDIPLWGESEEAANSGCETFAAYSLAFFQSDHSAEFTEALADTYTTAEIDAMTAWATEANTYYFAGRRDLIVLDTDALDALSNSGLFFGTYISSIFEDDLANDTEWSNLENAEI